MEKYRTPIGKSSSVYRRPNKRPPVFSNPPPKKSRDSDTRFTRSEDYRKKFLRHKRGLFGSKVFVCAYCGRLVTKTGMQVDHCIPVNAAKQSSFIRMYIRFIGMFQTRTESKQGINGLWNLVASCPSCNNKKSDKRGIWVVRGVFGRILFPLLWYVGIIGGLWLVAEWLLFGRGALAAAVQFLGQFGGFLR